MHAAEITSLRIAFVSDSEIPFQLIADARALLSGYEPQISSRRGVSWFSQRLDAQIPPPSLGPIRAATELLAAAHPGVDHAVFSGPIVSRGAAMLVMDVDSTLIQGEVIEMLARYCGTEKAVAEITEQAMRGEIDFEHSLRARVAQLEGVPANIFNDVYKQIVFSPGARELYAAAKANRVPIGIISGGFLEVVELIAKRTGITYFMANSLQVAGGKLTGRTTGPIVDRAAKKRLIREYAHRAGVDMRQVLALGDGANDLDMLAEAGLGISYCAKPIVRAQARANITFPRLDSALGYINFATNQV